VAILLGFAALTLSLDHALAASKTPELKQVTKPCEPTSKKVNINRATSAELQTLPGVGPVIAQRILEYRRKNPPFRKVEELLIIKGISPDRLQRMKGRISVE